MSGGRPADQAMIENCRDPGAETRTIPIRFMTEMLACASQRGSVDTARALATVGLPPDLLGQEGARVTVAQFGQLYRFLAGALDDECPGFFSRPLYGGTFKFLCLNLLNADNLRVALYRFGQYFRLMLDDLRFELGREDHLGKITVVQLAPPGPHHVLVHEVMLMLLQGVASWLVGRRIPFCRAEFAFPAPEYASEYANIYPAPVFFDYPRTAYYLELGYLDLPIRQSKSTLTTFLRNAPMDWIQVAVNEKRMTHRVRDILKTQLGFAATIESAAQGLHLSIRTLARRLEEEGTHFQAVKDALRRDVAIAQILNTNMSIASIGAMLGFDDPAAFNRAFRNWTGSPPGSYRRRGVKPSRTDEAAAGRD
ncbi:AraC family transcriptional regulator [Pseudochelatococcus lubricantis]|uniref:AraC family transcriptional regulator n=1 Tax=Pseudochelatococcus lubricantis TaxID=1538102 RepID=UPI0035F08B08